MLINGDKSNMEKNQYKIRLKELKELYDIGKKVSLVSGSKRATTIKSAQAEKVVEKVLLHCNSIIKLFNIGQNEYSELDIALIASAKSVSAQRNHVLAERKSTWENRSIENEGIFFK